MQCDRIKDCVMANKTTDKETRRSMPHRVNAFSIGSRVRIISYSPWRGLRGTVCAVNTISTDPDEPFCFYLIALEGAQIQEPVWFEYDEVEFISAPLVALQEST